MRSDYGHNLLNLLKKFQRLTRNEIVIFFLGFALLGIVYAVSIITFLTMTTLKIDFSITL